ncbi:NAD-dependent epimerase/dehydratase family protein [Methanorbis rubei]|uniref:NAD-dependent epimerase/dehydratase family protein n=1 Tax=Methanorbis rubei TaxID=3028300 RepID=UPI0030B90383
MSFNEINEIISKITPSYYEGKRALVTGGAGFLGSWMCESLLALGANVVCLDNYSSGREENIVHLQSNPNFTMIVQDVSKDLSLDDPFDYVFHLASRAGPFEFAEFPIEIIRSNTIGTMHALEIATKNHAKFLFTSTSETYGEPSVFPTPETYRGNVNAVGPRGCYDEAKRCGEALCMAYLRQKGVDVRIARIFNTYGPRIRADGIYGRVIPRFMDQIVHEQPVTIFGDGSQTRCFCYVTDTVVGLLRLAAYDGCTGEVVNIGSSHEMTILELAKMIYTICDKEENLTYHPMPQDDPTRRLPDVSKAENMLGWKADVTPEIGISRLLVYGTETL